LWGGEGNKRRRGEKSSAHCEIFKKQTGEKGEDFKEYNNDAKIKRGFLVTHSKHANSGVAKRVLIALWLRGSGKKKRLPTRNSDSKALDLTKTKQGRALKRRNGK